MLTTIIISLVISLFCAVSLGNFLPLLLPLLHPFFDRKPFNCRPCFTFHCTWLLMAVFACIYASWMVLGVGFAAALVVFAIVKYMDNQKIEK